LREALFKRPMHHMGNMLKAVGGIGRY